MIYAVTLLMIIAIVTDIGFMRIPNWLPVSLAVCYIFWALTSGHSSLIIGEHVVTGFAVLAIAFVLFSRGIIGGGDGKFIAAIALWFGLSDDLLRFAVLSGVLGGALSIMALTTRYIAINLPAPVWIPDWIVKQGHKIPYGVALGIAGIITYSDMLIQ